MHVDLESGGPVARGDCYVAVDGRVFLLEQGCVVVGEGLVVGYDGSVCISGGVGAVVLGGGG